MNEGFGAIKEINILGRQQSFIDEFRVSGKCFSEAYGSSNGLYNAPRYFIELIVYGGMICFILFLIGLYGGDLSTILPLMSVFGVTAFKLLPAFQQIYSGAAQIRGNLSALDAIKDDLYDARVDYGIDSYINCVSDAVIKGEIFLSDISFRYPGKEFNVLNYFVSI